MSQYNLPRTPSARAARRYADLKDQYRRQHKQRLRRDRRRWAFATMKQRRLVVRDYHRRRQCAPSEAEAARQTALRFSLGQSTVRRFYRYWRAGGQRALLPCYQQQSPAKTTMPWPLVEVILALRAHLGWCGQRIAAELQQRQIAQVSHTAIYRLFRRYHVPVRTYHPVGKRDGIRYRSQRTRAPNWSWHVDFAGPWNDPQGRKRSLVVVVDSYSRMLLALEVVPQQSAEVVEAVLGRLFAQQGAPRVLITDNGRAFAPSLPHQGHRFGRFLAAHGVDHRRTRPYYPQTNGKVEAAIKTIEREFLRRMGWQKASAAASAAASATSGASWCWHQVAAAASSFQGWYNFYRCHGALGYRVPAQRYAGVVLPKLGLANIFGLMSESVVLVESLPVISQANRMDRLALTVVT